MRPPASAAVVQRRRDDGNVADVHDPLTDGLHDREPAGAGDMDETEPGRAVDHRQQFMQQGSSACERRPG
jgi:hypothetical protein